MDKLNEMILFLVQFELFLLNTVMQHLKFQLQTTNTTDPALEDFQTALRLAIIQKYRAIVQKSLPYSNAVNFHIKIS